MLISRRRFLRDSAFLSAGLASGALINTNGKWLTLENQLFAQQSDRVWPEDRLRKLGISLPQSPQPVAVYVPAVRSGNMLYASGHGPRTAGGELIQGRVGDDLTLEQGYAAARLVGLNVLSTVKATIGSLNNVKRLVKVLGMVNCTSNFAQQPQVINGFSDLMVEVFGEQHGKGARSAVGMNALPSNIAVEIEAIFEIGSTS